MRALPAPLGAEAAQHTGAEELPQVQKPLLEQTAYDTGPRQPCLAQGQISASGNLITPAVNLVYVATALVHLHTDDNA